MLIRAFICFGLATLLACSSGAEPVKRQQAAESSAAASFQGRIDPGNRDLHNARVPEHGVRSYSAEFRTRLAADTVVMNYYAGLPKPSMRDRYVVWLRLSGPLQGNPGLAITDGGVPAQSVC